MSYIQEPYFAIKAWEVITQRDLGVIDDKNDFLDYLKDEILLSALCVAEVVELVARALFSFVIVPYYFVRGHSFETYRNSIIYTALTIGMTGRALFHNVFSKFAFISSIGSASNLMGFDKFPESLIEYFTDVENKKVEAIQILNSVTPYSKYNSGFAV